MYEILDSDSISWYTTSEVSASPAAASPPPELFESATTESIVEDVQYQRSTIAESYFPAGVEREVVFLRDTAAKARSELAAGATILVGSSVFSFDENGTLLSPYADAAVVQSTIEYAANVLSLREDGAAVELGECGFSAVTSPLRDFSEAISGELTPAETVVRVVSGDGDVLARLRDFVDPPAELPWSEKPVEERNLNLRDTPREVFDRYETVIVEFRAPDTMLDGSASLCSRTPDGWGPCVWLSKQHLDAPNLLEIHYLPEEEDGIELLLLYGDDYDSERSNLQRLDLSVLRAISDSTTGPDASPVLQIGLDQGGMFKVDLSS